MKELCALLNQLVPSFLQRLVPKILPYAPREIHNFRTSAAYVYKRITFWNNGPLS